MAGNTLALPRPSAWGGTWTRALASERVGWVLAAVACGLFTVVLTLLALAQHAAYSTGRQDLEIYAQVIWNTANGRLYETTLLKTNQNHLAEHLAGAALLLAPLYKLWPQPSLLIAVQQIALGLGGLPVFALARARRGGTVLALVVTGAYLASPALAGIALDDFHPVALTVLPLGMSLYWLHLGRQRLALGAGVFAMFLEEEAALVVMGIGLMLLVLRHWKQSAVWFSIGFIWLAIAVFVIMPRFHTADTVADGAPNRTVGHFQELRERPTVLTDRLFGERARDALTSLALPSAGLPLLAPAMLIVDAPSFAALFLQDRDDTFRRHWAAPMLVVLWMATATGLAYLPAGRARLAGATLLVAAIAIAYRLDSPLPGGGRYDAERFQRTDRSLILDDLVSRVPGDARVAASVNVVAHLAHRSGVYVFPPGDHYAEQIEKQAKRPNAYVLDLFDPGTQRIAALDRFSPLYAKPAYTVWSPGRKALLLLDEAPSVDTPSDLTFSDNILLRGHSIRRIGDQIELELQWQKYRALRGRYARQLIVTDGQGRTLEREDDMSLSSVFGVNKWQLNQVVVDTVRIRPPASDPAGLTARVAWTSRDKDTPVRVSDGTYAVEIPLTPR